uniref:Putative secreted protein n=1 Tax=Anopheles darlingi TaxID=43151 RepID=A0A2M4DKY8_ANODA
MCSSVYYLLFTRVHAVLRPLPDTNPVLIALIIMRFQLPSIQAAAAVTIGMCEFQLAPPIGHFQTFQTFATPPLIHHRYLLQNSPLLCDFVFLERKEQPSNHRGLQKR